MINVIGTLNTIMSANMAAQNYMRNEISKQEEEKRKKVQPTFESTFNKEKRKEK